jgi:hypothetical protein
MLGVDFARSERTSSVGEVDVRTDITHECGRSCLTCKHVPNERRIDNEPFDGFDGEFAYRIGGPRPIAIFCHEERNHERGRRIFTQTASNQESIDYWRELPLAYAV